MKPKEFPDIRTSSLTPRTVNIFKKCRAWDYLKEFAQAYDTMQVGDLLFSTKKIYFIFCHNKWVQIF